MLLLFVSARDVWKKNYFDEKKKTSPLEDETQKMQQELEMLHKRIVSNLEPAKDTGRKRDTRPSQKVRHNCPHLSQWFLFLFIKSACRL